MEFKKKKKKLKWVFEQLPGFPSGVALTLKLGSSFMSSSFSSLLFSLYLSPSLPEYLWKVATITASACSRGHAMGTAWGHGQEGTRGVGRAARGVPSLIPAGMGKIQRRNGEINGEIKGEMGE